MLSYELAPKGSTGNTTHSGIRGLEGATKLALEFEVEAVGATPTVTLSLQGTIDGTNWFAIAHAGTDASSPGQSAAGIAVTTVGKTYRFIIGGNSATVSLGSGYLFLSGVRLVTSANTNVTYSARLYRVDKAS